MGWQGRKSLGVVRLRIVRDQQVYQWMVIRGLENRCPKRLVGSSPTPSPISDEPDGSGRLLVHEPQELTHI